MKSAVGSLTRRRLLSLVPLFASGLFTGCREEEQLVQTVSDLQALLDSAVADPKIPGVSAALVQGERLLWRGAAGFADLEGGVEMTVNHVLNIASISKTVTATAVMQQVEMGKLEIDRDVNDYLSFPVRNPKFPGTPITTRQLLIHRSSIADGSAYAKSYACGDPALELGVWVKEYLKSGGQFYNEKENFHEWAPGATNPPTSPRTYSNVAYGLLGHLVEETSGQEFGVYCKSEIFDVLGMSETRWMIGDRAQHALPHYYANKKFELDKDESIADYLFTESTEASDIKKGDVFPHCLYSFYNYPDGLLRTNPSELSSFLRAYIGGGQLSGKRILREESVQQMFTEHHAGRGLCWSIDTSLNGGRVFQHSGSDPGVSTYMGFREQNTSGAILFFNCSNPGDHAEKILRGMGSLADKA